MGSKKFSDFDLPARKFDFRKDLAYGHQGEKLVTDFLDAMSEGAFEVKTDRYRNGRMVIEMEQNPRRKGEWIPSGLQVTKAAWWVYVFTLDGAFVMVSVARIKRYIQQRQLGPKEYKEFARASQNPSRGFLLEAPEVVDLMTSPDYDEPDDEV
jgi:hypothetical protein